MQCTSFYRYIMINKWLTAQNFVTFTTKKVGFEAQTEALDFLLSKLCLHKIAHESTPDDESTYHT